MSKNIVIKVKLPKQNDKKAKSKAGKRGRTGDTGPMGPKGDMGHPGAQGIMGRTGEPGQDGRDGVDGRVDANTLLDVIETDPRVIAAIQALVAKKTTRKTTTATA